MAELSVQLLKGFPMMKQVCDWSHSILKTGLH